MTSSSSLEERLAGLPDELVKKYTEFDQKLAQVEATINNIDANTLADSLSQLQPLDKARFDWMSIYSINSLFFVYLKMNGVNLKDHPLIPELTRVKSYLTRINEIQKAEELKKEQNLQRIDKESSARIIKRSLWMNAQSSAGGAKSKATSVSDLVNKTLETGLDEPDKKKKKTE